MTCSHYSFVFPPPLQIMCSVFHGMYYPHSSYPFTPAQRGDSGPGSPGPLGPPLEAKGPELDASQGIFGHIFPDFILE